MIVIGGENLIDFIQVEGGAGLPVYRANPGGSPFNTAMAAGLQGQATGYLTPISDDKLGVLLRKRLEDSNVTCLAPASSKPSSLAVVSVESGQPSYQFYREDTAERQVDSASLRAWLPEQVTALQIGSLALANGEDAEAWAQLVEELATRGVPITFDPNIRAAFIHDRAEYLDRFRRVARVATLIKLSDEDIDWLYPGHSIDEAASTILTQSAPAILVVTKGADGSIGFANGIRVEDPARPVNGEGDTVGAGDTFMATLVVALARRVDFGTDMAALSEADLASLLRRAGTAAAINCGRKGCNPPTEAELEAALS